MRRSRRAGARPRTSTRASRPGWKSRWQRRKALETELGNTRNTLAGQSSRLRSLLELEQRLEGYQKGVQTVMSARKEAASSDRLGTIHGIVADMIETEPRYEMAIEAVLGDRLQSVVVDSQNDSLKAINYLKSESGGRSTFLPRMPREIRSEPFIKNGHAGVIGSALSVVRYQDDNRNVAQYLLGDVVVVDTMDTALYLWNKNGFSKTVVTLAGRDRRSLGRRHRRRRRCRRIRHAHQAARDQGPGAGGHGAQVTDCSTRDRTDGRGSLDRGGYKDLGGALAAGPSHGDRAGEPGEGLHRDPGGDAGGPPPGRPPWEQKPRNAPRFAPSWQPAIEQAAATLRELEAGHASAQASIESLQAELSLKREELEAARVEITEIKMEVTALQEKQAAATRSIAALTQMSLEFADRFAKREAEITDIAATLTDLEASIAGAEDEIKGFIETLEAERRVLLTRQEAHAAVTSSLHAAEEQARQVRHDIETAQKRLSANEVRRTELRMKIEHLKDSIWTIVPQRT